MGQRYSVISDKLKHFIESQKIFFVGTAAAEGRINVSPKGMDTLRVVDRKRIVWLNLTGSGNETSAHVQQNPRMTLMFVAFDGKPMILRLYGDARVVHQNDRDWAGLYALFQPLPGSRQIFDVAIDLVQTSCGMAVPCFDYAGDRQQLKHWAERKGQLGIRQYWGDNNQISLDGDATNIIEKNV